jgi:hypothetical protein
MNCKNCGLPIARIVDPWGGVHGWYHTTIEKEVNIDGADVMTYATECPDDQGEAEPVDVQAKVADLAEVVIKVMDLYWEPDIERVKYYLGVAYMRGATEVRP